MMQPNDERRLAIFAEMRERVFRETDRMFQWLFLAQWLLAIGLTLVISPYTYDGATRHIHFHVQLALGFGGLLNIVPIGLIRLRPGWWGTRHVVAVTQMMWSAVLIVVTGGRIETHFHVFGSLAFLAFYRDWKVIVTATLVVVADHLARGLWWPDSVYGVLDPEWWRFLEHAAWVAFEDVVLWFGCRRQVSEMRAAAAREAALELTNTRVEGEVQRRTAELRGSLDRYRELVETTAAIPFEWDRVGRRMLYIAPQIGALLGCDAARLGEPGVMLDSIHADDHAHLYEATELFVAGERPANEPIDLRLLASDGRTHHVRLFQSAIAEGGRLIRGVMIDVTQQTQLQRELQQAQKLESVGRLAAGMAHEINTPLQFVGDSLQFVRDSLEELFAALPPSLAETDDDFAYLVEQCPKALDRSLDGLARVKTIVRSLKVFAHPDQAAMTPIDLGAALDATLMIARNEYRYVADIETHYAELPKVHCYGGEINQVILNLVINAAHAISDVVGTSGARGKITIATRRDGRDVVVSVADTGGGIPDTVREHIFDYFFTTKEVGRGTGQGLAIARSLVVDKHAGSLTFDTTIGVGTTFYVRIPIEPPSMPMEVAA